MWQGPDSAAEWERLRDTDDPDDPDGTRQDDADPSLQGRAARRRQLERWKKNRRRAAAATAVALVGGGLTVAALPHGGARGRADTAAAAEPLTPANARTLPLSSIPAQPGDDATHRPGQRAHPTTAAPRGHAPGAAPSAASTTTSTTRSATAPERTAAQGGTGPRVRTVPAVPAPADTAPHTTAPSSAPHSPADDQATPPTTTATPTPSATKSPMQLCLLVLCVG
ncbi:hypothetical protein ACFW3D_08785 [Streptomyces sp. NPDC058864]